MVGQTRWGQTRGRQWAVHLHERSVLYWHIYKEEGVSSEVRTVSHVTLIKFRFTVSQMSQTAAELYFFKADSGLTAHTSAAAGCWVVVGGNMSAVLKTFPTFQENIIWECMKCAHGKKMCYKSRPTAMPLSFIVW